MDDKELIRIKEILLEPIQLEIGKINKKIDCIQKKIEDLRMFKTKVITTASFISLIISGVVGYFAGKR